MTEWVNRRDDWEIFKYDEKKAETPKAYLLVMNGQEHWVPKSQAELLDDEIVQMSPWIAGEKGLV